MGDPGSVPGLEGPLEEGMATHSSILAWRVPWMRSLVGYSPWGCKELDTTETTHTRTSAPVTRAGLPGLLTVCGQQVVRRFTSVFDRWLLTGWWSAGVRGSLGLASPIISGGSTSSQVVAAAFLRASLMHMCFSSPCLHPLCSCLPLIGPR